MTDVVWPPLTQKEREEIEACEFITVGLERLADGRLALLLPEPAPAALPTHSRHPAMHLCFGDRWDLRVDISCDLSVSRDEE